MQLPMTYLERKLRGDRTLVFVGDRIYEPDAHEQDMANFLKLGNDGAALIDGPGVGELEDLWETEYKREISAFIDEEARQITPGKMKGSKLEEEIIKTELKHFIVFKVFRKFVSDQGKLSKALSRLTKEYNAQETGIQQSIEQHLKGEKSDAEIEQYGLTLFEPVIKQGSRVRLRKNSGLAEQNAGIVQDKFFIDGEEWIDIVVGGYKERYKAIDLELADQAVKKIQSSSIAEKLAKRLGQPLQKEPQKEEPVEEPAAEPLIQEKKDFVFSKTFKFDMLVIDDLIYPLQPYEGKKKTFLKIDGKHFVSSEKPTMQIYDLIDIYRANLEKKYKDAAYFSQPRIKKLKDMQALIDDELKRPIYQEKMLEIAETSRPDTMWIVMGFGEFVNRGDDGDYFLFPPGKIAVKVEWNDGSITNGYPVNWGDYYAPNITGSGQSQTSLCLNNYNNEGNRMRREEKIADYLAHAVRTMQHGYRPGEARVYHTLTAIDSKFRAMRISKSEMEKKGLRPLNID